ncbi:MAG: flagellar biosynthetic protein FliR [Planctomycetota bacterium]
MTRAAPQMNLYSVGFPLRVLVSLAAMTFLLPQFVSGVVGMFSLLLEILRMRG